MRTQTRLQTGLLGIRYPIFEISIEMFSVFLRIMRLRLIKVNLLRNNKTNFKMRNTIENSITIFNERKLVLELLNVVKVKVKVKITMKKFRNCLLLPESLNDL